jgi:superfamily II DNA/RNA helicase
VDEEFALLHPIQAVPAVSPTLPSFESFQLAAPLLRGLKDAGFLQPTEIQARAIPVALAGRDLLASAQTGTGKTAAFALPALMRLLKPSTRKGRGPRVLVLTPTRELAGQVEGVIRGLGRHARVTCGTIVGGVAYGPQEELLRRPLDVLVATPGRLIDHMERGLVDFARLELLVLDEADRMLDMGFIHPVRQIAAALPGERQTLLFSATLEGDVHSISRALLRDPERIELASVKVRHEAISQRMHMAISPEHKLALLTGLLAAPDLTQAIVFTATKRGADRLAKRLAANGHACTALHGNLSQNARQRAVNALRSGKLRILVATDVAARGIDILGVSHVINFDLPMVAEDYIHRIGRTGRNGATGQAISLVGPQDRVKLLAIERLTGRRIERESLDMTDPGPDHERSVPVAPSRPGASRPRQGGRPASGASARPSRGGARPAADARRPHGSTPGGAPPAQSAAAGNGAAAQGGGVISFTPSYQRRRGRSRSGIRSSWSG